MEIQIDDLYLNRDVCPELDFFYQAITEALRDSGLSDRQAKSQAIANRVFYRCTTSGCDPEEVVWQFAKVIVHIYAQIPDNHAWQDILIDAVINLRERSMHEPKSGKYWGTKPSWQDLFPLYTFVVDHRQRKDAPNEFIENLAH